MERNQWVKSANGTGIEELLYLMEAFQDINDIKLEVAFTVEKVGLRSQLVGTVTAWDQKVGAVDQSPLGSQSVTCSAINLRTVEAVSIHLLYMLDGWLARREMQGGTQK